MTADAIMIGAGPNGLVAANLLTDAGWDVVVLEAQREPGGAVRSAEVLEPGFVTARFSAFYPLGAVFPHLAALELDRHGLQWSHARAVLAHPCDDANLINGDKNLGSAKLHQQLIFRPVLGFGRPETPVSLLFLASASAHPGGGVHGSCGAHAARAAVRARRRGHLLLVR